MARSISNLEDEMRNLEEREARDSPSGQSSAANKTEIGIVDRFF